MISLKGVWSQGSGIRYLGQRVWSWGDSIPYPLVVISSGSQYASYWNVFLFSFLSEIIMIGFASTLLNNLDLNNLAEIPLTVSRLYPYVS